MCIADRVYRVRLTDDGLIYIPVSFVKSGIDPGNLIHVTLYTSAPTTADPWYTNAIVNASGNSVVVELGITKNVKFMNPTGIGSTDPDGSLNVGLASTGVTIRNRLGSEIYGTLEVKV
jgi:hypothetical protein